MLRPQSQRRGVKSDEIENLARLGNPRHYDRIGHGRRGITQGLARHGTLHVGQGTILGPTPLARATAIVTARRARRPTRRVTRRFTVRTAGAGALHRPGVGGDRLVVRGAPAKVHRRQADGQPDDHTQPRSIAHDEHRIHYAAAAPKVRGGAQANSTIARRGGTDKCVQAARTRRDGARRPFGRALLLAADQLTEGSPAAEEHRGAEAESISAALIFRRRPGQTRPDPLKSRDASPRFASAPPDRAGIPP